MATTPENLMTMEQTVFLWTNGGLLLNQLPENWRHGLVLAEDGRIARFERDDARPR